MGAISYLTKDERLLRRDEIKEIINGSDTGMEILYSDKDFLQVLKKYFVNSKPTLDVGSGPGTLLQLLHKWGFTETYGLDIDDYLDAARPIKEFRIVDLNFDRLPWKDEFFTNIAAIETVEHLENPYHFLREMARVLSKDGTFILTTPNPDHIWNKLSFLRKGEFYRFLAGTDHLTLFSDPVLKKGTLRYFNLAETYYVGGVIPYRFFRYIPVPDNKYFGHSVIHVFKKL